MYDSSSRGVGYTGRINATLGAANYFVRLDRLYDTTNTNYTLDLKYVANPISSVVTLETIDGEASETGINPGVVRIRRQGDTSKAQTVTYSIDTGNKQATNGVDYAKLSGSITMGATLFR